MRAERARLSRHADTTKAIDYVPKHWGEADAAIANLTASHAEAVETLGPPAFAAKAEAVAAIQAQVLALVSESCAALAVDAG